MKLGRCKVRLEKLWRLFGRKVVCIYINVLYMFFGLVFYNICLFVQKTCCTYILSSWLRYYANTYVYAFTWLIFPFLLRDSSTFRSGVVLIYCWQFDWFLVSFFVDFIEFAWNVLLPIWLLWGQSWQCGDHGNWRVFPPMPAPRPSWVDKLVGMDFCYLVWLGFQKDVPLTTLYTAVQINQVRSETVKTE